MMQENKLKCQEKLNKNTEINFVKLLHYNIKKN